MIDDELKITQSIAPFQAIDIINQYFSPEEKKIIGIIGLEAMNAEGFFVGSRGNNLLQAEEWRNLFSGLAKPL